MNAPSSTETASQDITTLFYLIGKAVWQIQEVEDALSHLITLKKEVQSPNKISKQESEKILEKYRSFVFGKTLGIAQENCLYSDRLHDDLTALKAERNWLVHKCAAHHREDMHISSKREELFRRIKAISKKAKTLQYNIEIELVEFSESKGLDMSNIRAAIKYFYQQIWES